MERIGLVGQECVARVHAGQYADMEDATVAAVASPSHAGEVAREYAPDATIYDDDATLTLIGTGGELSIDCLGQTLRRTRDGGDDPGIRSVYWGATPDVGMIADFVEAVRDDRVPETTGKDGVREVAVCVAAYESAERGGPVPIDY